MLNTPEQALQIHSDRGPSVRHRYLGHICLLHTANRSVHGVSVVRAADALLINWTEYLLGISQHV
jgi:hypothetical protein